MTVCEPEVFLIAETKINPQEIYAYLQKIGVDLWITDATTDSEALIEIGGRLCYKSWIPGLNKNVTRVREGNGPYIKNIISSFHGSVLEHASCSFIFHNISRVLSAELCRHRAGIAISEQSLRFVRLDDLKIFVSSIFETEEQREYFLSKVEQMEAWQVEMVDLFQLDSKSFADKKKITSAMRRLAPLGLGTDMLWTANIRALRHIIEMRTSPHAEEEIRLLFDKVGALMKKKYANLFFDFERGDDGSWVSKHNKV